MTGRIKPYNAAGLVVFLWAMSVQLSVFGSDNGQPFLKLLYHQGFHVHRSTYLEERFDEGFRAVELQWGWQTTGAKAWHQIHHYPAYGIGLHYADQVRSRRDTVLGNPLSLFGFYQAPIARFGRFSLNTSISVGISYTSLISDPRENPFNDLVASHINMYFDWNLNMGFRLGERWDLHAGYGVNHYSNGNIQEPQKGLNNWGWNAGASYHFGGGEQPFRRSSFTRHELPGFDPFEELQLMLAVGINEWQPSYQHEGQHYFTSSFTADYAYRFSIKSALTLGLNVLYDGSLERAIKGLKPEEVTTWQKLYLGGHFGYQYTISRVTLLVNLGTYFFQSSYDRRFFFMRAGGRIRLTDPLALHICIKSRNGIRSDWIEWGLAWSIKTR